MQINFIYDPSVANAPSGFVQGLAAAANIIDAAILNPISINIAVGYGEDNGAALANGTLGEAQPAFGILQSYSQVAAQLSRAATSAADASVVANLPAADPSHGAGFFVSVAQAIAWGVRPASSTEIEGYAGFSSTLRFDYDPSNGIAAGTYDFVGVAVHELTHALGRYADPRYLTPQSLLSYGGPGTLDSVASSPRYISADGGKTSLGSLDTRTDPADFASVGPPDAFDAAISSGTALPWSSLDSEMMDILGYQTAGAAPPAAGAGPVVSSATTGAAPGGASTGAHFTFSSTTTNSIGRPSNGGGFIHTHRSSAVTGGDGAGPGIQAANHDWTGAVGGNAADLWRAMQATHAGESAGARGLTPSDFGLARMTDPGAACAGGSSSHAVGGWDQGASLGWAAGDAGHHSHHASTAVTTDQQLVSGVPG